MRAEIQIVTVVINEFEGKHGLASLSRIFLQRKHDAETRDCAAHLSVVGSPFVRRIPIFVVILALLATPLALLARARSCESPACTMTCCLPHGSHSRAGQWVTCHCSTKSGKRLPDFGLIAPIAPTTPERFGAVAAPDAVRYPVRFWSASLTQGFTATPFIPPRA